MSLLKKNLPMPSNNTVYSTLNAKLTERPVLQYVQFVDTNQLIG